MGKETLIKFAVILSLLPTNYSFAEIVNLKSGKKIEGKITEKTDQYIKIEIDGSPLYYERKYVESIDVANNPAATEEDTSIKDANFYLKKGMKYASQGKLKEAEEEFKKGLEIDSSSHNLQEVMNTINDLKNGTIKQNEALYLFKGSNYLINEQYKEAIAEFKEALRLDPENPDLYYYLGVCNYSLQEYEEAINCLKKAQVKNPNDSELNYFLGISNYSLGRYAQAITDLQKALEINPDDAQAYSIIGASNYSLGESQLAKSNLSKSKELFQKKGDYLKAAEIEEFLGAIK